MLTYKYKCNSCKHSWEEEQSIKDAPTEVCPKCHEKSAQRIVQPSTFILKGSGWYETDYKNKPKKGKE